MTENRCSLRCRGPGTKAHSWPAAPAPAKLRQPAAPLHIDQRFLQPRALPLQDLWPCQACSAPPAIGRVLAPGPHQQPSPPDAVSHRPPGAPAAAKSSGDGSQPLLSTSTTPSLLFPLSTSLSSKHPAGPDLPNAGNAPLATDIAVGGSDALPPDTACRPDTTPSAYDTARALVSQAWNQSYTPMFTLGRIALKIPDRHPSDLPPASVWTRPYCEALEGEGIALVGAYVRHGCIHIVLDFLDLAVGPPGGGGGAVGGGSGFHHHPNPYAPRNGRHHLLGSERNCSSGSSRSASRSNSRRRSGRAGTAWGEPEGGGGAAGGAGGVSLLTQMGGRASAPGDLLPLAAPGREAQQQQPHSPRQRRLQLERRNAPARVLSASAAAAVFAARVPVLSRNAVAAAVALGGHGSGAGGGSTQSGADEDDDDDDDDGSSSGAVAAAARPRSHPLSARRLRQLRRASVPSLLSGPPPNAAAAATVALSPLHDGVASPLVVSLSPSVSSAMSSSRLLESLTPELLVGLLGPGIGGGGQTVTVQLPLGGGAWSVQTLQAGPPSEAAPAAAAAAPPPPDLTCISPPCVLAGAPGPVVLYAAGTNMQGVTSASHVGGGADAAAAAGAPGAAAGGSGGGPPLTVHVRYRGAYLPCRASLLGDQMPAEALSWVLPLDALRRAEVLCLQLPEPPTQPGLMFLECQRGGLLGAALPVLVAPSEGVCQEVAALQSAAVQEGGGQVAAAQRLVTDLGLWLDYLNTPPPQQQQQRVEVRPVQLASPLLAPRQQQLLPLPPVHASHMSSGPCPSGGVSAPEEQRLSVRGGGEGAAGGGPILGRLFGRSLLQLLNDAEEAEPAAEPQPRRPQDQRQGGVRMLEEMLTLVEQREEQQRCLGLPRGAAADCDAARAAAAAAAAASPFSGGGGGGADLHLVAPHVGVAYGSSPGPNRDGCDGGDGGEAAGETGGMAEYVRAISDPQTRRVDAAVSAVTAAMVAEASAEAGGDVPPGGDEDGAAVAEGLAALRMNVDAAPAVPGRTQLAAGSVTASAPGGGPSGGRGAATAACSIFAALRAFGIESSRRLGPSAGMLMEGLGPGLGASSNWPSPGLSAGFDPRPAEPGLGSCEAALGPVGAAAVVIAGASVAAGGAAADGSRVSSCDLSLAGAPPPPHAQSMLNGRWQLPPQPPPRAEKAAAAQAEASGSSSVAAAPAAVETSEASGSAVSIVSADLLAFCPAEAATLSQALMSFGPFTSRSAGGGAAAVVTASGSLNLPPVRTDSSGTELRSWDSLTEVALAGMSSSASLPPPPSSGGLSVTPLPSSTTAASPSPSPRPSVHLQPGDGPAHLRPLAPGGGGVAVAASVAGFRRSSIEQETAWPHLETMTAESTAPAPRAGTSPPAGGATSPPAQQSPGAAPDANVDAPTADAAPSLGVVVRVHSISSPAPASGVGAVGRTAVVEVTIAGAAVTAADGIEVKPPVAVPSDAVAGGPHATASGLDIAAAAAAAADGARASVPFEGEPVVATVCEPPPEPLHADAEAAALLPLGACWPTAAAAAGSEAATSARLLARMQHLGLGLLAFSLRRGWVATTTQLLTGLAQLGVGLAEADVGVAAREGGMGLLHLAVTARAPALLRALPKAAAAAAAAEPSPFAWDVGARGPVGLTPLHLATALDDGGEVAALLLEAYPDAPALWFTAADDGGCTPAEMAGQARLGSLSQLARSLLLLRTTDGAAVVPPLSLPRQPQPPPQLQMEELQQLQRDLQPQGRGWQQQQRQEDPAWLRQLAPLGPTRCDGRATAAAPTTCQGASDALAAAAGPAASGAVVKLSRWPDATPPAPPVQQQRNQPPKRGGPSWLRASLDGFADPRVEAQYRMCRATALAVVDQTCGLVFLGLFLLPAADLARQRRWPELASHCFFNVGLLGPYALAAASPPTFRRHRDAALMATDVLKAALVVLALLRALPVPAVWANFARGGMDVLMLVVIKPLAEQIRIRAALLQRAAAVVSDTHIYAVVLYGGAVIPALARALLQNAAALALLVLLDVRARQRFQRAMLAPADGAVGAASGKAAAVAAAAASAALEKVAAAAAIAVAADAWGVGASAHGGRAAGGHAKAE